MKIILLENIPKLGRKFEVKEVKAGYARNFLLPRKKVMPATKTNIQKIEKMKEQEREKQQILTEKLTKIGKSAKKIVLSFQKKANSEGKLFGSIGKKEIKKALEDYGVKIDKDVEIDLDKPLKKTGKHHIYLVLGDKRIPIGIQIKAVTTHE